MNIAFNAKLLKKYDVTYRQCPDCGLLQSEEPFWLDEAYNDAIAVADTGLVMRNFSLSSKLSVLLYLLFPRRGSYLDVAGGYGMLARLMRDYGFDYYWDDKYCQNVLARGFEAAESKKPFDAMTAFEVIEHVPNPIEFVSTQMEQHNCRTLIFSTELYEGPTPPPLDWWYYAFNSGQHITLYQRKTLDRLAQRLGLQLLSVNGIHILTDKPLKVTAPLRIATGRLAPLFALLIRRVLGSLTQSDHSMLIAR